MVPDPPPHDDGCRWSAPLAAAPGRAGLGRAGLGRAGLGRAGEDAALAHLVRVHGLDPVARNHRIALDELRGELDLVLRDPRTGLVVVCEVKTRVAAAARDGAVAALGPRQRARIRRLASALAATTDLRPRGLRLDLVAVDVPGAGSGAAHASLLHLPAAW
jgi:Holliday junction resolvase-like predicted endonuclease